MAAFLQTFKEFQHGTKGPARGIFKIPAATNRDIKMLLLLLRRQWREGASWLC